MQAGNLISAERRYHVEESDTDMIPQPIVMSRRFTTPGGHLKEEGGGDDKDKGRYH